jgi:hypothetical protein
VEGHPAPRCSKRATRSARAGPILVALSALIVSTASAEPLRLRADAVAEARAPAGLIVLQGEDKYRPWVDAEAMVWAGARADPASTLELRGLSEMRTADVMILTLRLREPHGLGELRGGRFVFATGAIRPIQVDGVSALVRSPWGTTVEAMGGIPTLPQAIPRANERVGGARVAQTIAARATAGFSYFLRESRGDRVTDEVGADMAVVPTSYLDLAGKGAYDLLSRGVAEASFSTALRFAPWRFELFGSQRSPGRLLPATSLFSVLGDFPAQTLGTSVRWEAAPRLDLLASAAGQVVGGHLGSQSSLRATLRTDDQGAGRVGLEVRRQDVSTAQWTGVRAIVSQPLSAHFGASTELEIARPDVPADRGSIWPWGLLALSWRSEAGWEAAAAVEAGATPLQRFETNALLRLARTLEVP